MASARSNLPLKPRLLLVDDDTSLLSLLAPLLNLHLPYLVVEPCPSGSRALSQVVASDYHAVLSDLNMPKLDGLALLRGARAIRPRMPFLLMTGAVDLALTRQAFESGAFDIIAKPFDFTQLTGSIRLAIKASEMDRQCQDACVRLIHLMQVHAQSQERLSSRLAAALKGGLLERTVPLIEQSHRRIEQSIQCIERQIETLGHFLDRQVHRRAAAEQQAQHLAYARVGISPSPPSSTLLH